MTACCGGRRAHTSTTASINASTARFPISQEQLLLGGALDQPE